MIARKKKKLIIIISIVLIILIIIGTLVALYFTTDMFKSNYSLFVKYLSQNINIVGDMAKKDPTEITNAIQNQKLTTNLKGNISYTDNNNDSESTLNKAELDITGQIDKLQSYRYENVRLAYENSDVAKIEYIKNGNQYAVRLDGIKQYVSATNTNLEELEVKTGIEKKDLELLTYIFEPLNLSNFISFTDSEINVLSSTYLSILQQNTQTSNYVKKAGENVVVNENTYKATAYSLKLPEEEFNNLIIAILERIEKDEIILGKIDNMQNMLEKYYIFENEKTLRELAISAINQKIQYIKDNNIGNEETEITVYEYKGKNIKTMIKTPKKTISIDTDNTDIIKIDYIETLDNKENEQIFTINRQVTNNAQNLSFKYIKSSDGEEEKNFALEITQNKENSEITNNYNLTYIVDGNNLGIKISQYINVVNEFEEKQELTNENNISLDSLNESDAEMIMEVVKNNFNNQISNTLDKIQLDDINKMLKDIGIIKTEIKFDDVNEETVTEAERNRFNSQLTLYIGKEITTSTLKQMSETLKDRLVDIQFSYEGEDEDDKEFKGMIIDVKRNSSNPSKIEEMNKVLDENEDTKFTVAMSYDENTKLINKITVVSNDFLEQ